jgi:hypothetical protein
MKVSPIMEVQGKIQALEVDEAAGLVRISSQESDNPVELDTSRRFRIVDCEGGRIQQSSADGDTMRWKLIADRQTLVRFKVDGVIP